MKTQIIKFPVKFKRSRKAGDKRTSAEIINFPVPQTLTEIIRAEASRF